MHSAMVLTLKTFDDHWGHNNKYQHIQIHMFSHTTAKGKTTVYGVGIENY